MTTVIPLNQLQRRAPEAGRIRLGVKTGRAMKSIDTFRFTSPHEQAIRDLADKYGGQPKPWQDPKAPAGQWEVITDANAIRILVLPDGLSTNYELWTGGGCARRCDGITCVVAGRDGDQSVPCICDVKGQHECRPYTRLNVVLPDIDFYGTWRMETKGWNAAKELPGMFDLVTEYANMGSSIRATLHLEQRKSVRNGQTRNFVVPTISVAASPDALLAGEGTARPQLDAAPPELRELGSGTTDSIQEQSHDQDDEIIEAQIIDIELEQQLEDQIRTIASQHSLDPDAVVAAIWTATQADYGKLGRFIERNAEGKTLAWTQKGTLTWRS